MNLVKEWETTYYESHEYKYEHCLHVAYQNVHKKEVLDLLLRSAKEKGIDIHAKMNDRFGHTETLRDAIINTFANGDLDKEGHTDETYKILNIDPSVDLFRNSQ